jgi:hypothetical protein
MNFDMDNAAPEPALARSPSRLAPACDSRRPLHYAETSAVLYLVSPLFIFFACFIRFEIAVPACALIALLIYELIRLTSWREFLAMRRESAYFLVLAAAWVWLSGGMGLSQNFDWAKHYVIIDFLTEHPWPATDRLQHYGDSALRYYLGWYLVPAAIQKIVNSHVPIFAMSAWSTLGVFLFFSLLPGLVGKRWGLFAAPLVFIFFGGADFIGERITQSYSWIPYHFEWWVGWAQFSSNTMALFWVPQHAIAAWLGVAILMRTRHNDNLLPYLALMCSATLLWSPFSAVGFAPFLLMLLIQRRPRLLVLNWRAMASVVLLAIPVALYLSAGSTNIPHGFIGTMPCTLDDYVCFTWPLYFLFLAIEIGAPITILLLHRKSERGFLLAAAGALCLIPLYKIGLVNDFAMRTSLPSLAVLAILCANLLTTGRRPFPTAVIAVLLLALPTVLGELIRGFLPNYIPADAAADPVTADETFRWWIEQYFAPQPIWVLR